MKYGVNRVTLVANLIRLLRPHRGRFVLPDRLRPRSGRGARCGADGPAGHRGQRRPMLIGAVLLHAEYGTFSVPELAERVRSRRPTHHGRGRADRGRGTGQERAGTPALLAAASDGGTHPRLGLPAFGGDGRRRRARPGPGASAAGARATLVLDGLVVIGFASIVVGGVLALGQDELKQILAHSTISQYGYVVVLYGLGGAAGAAAAAFYVVAHAIAKSALFMTAGAITEATGESRLSRLGGLARSMPALAIASGIAAATLAAVPLTIGFFKDELFFTAALGAGGPIPILAVGAAALTVAYIGRFWLGLFTGRRRTESSPIPDLLVIPVVLLAVVALVGGIVVGPFAALAGAAASISHGGPVIVEPTYHLDLRSENVMALTALAVGAAALGLARVREPVVRAVSRLGDLAGPRRWYGVILNALHVVSHRLHDAEVRDLRTSIAAIILPTGLLIALAIIATPTVEEPTPWAASRQRICRSSSCSASPWSPPSPSRGTAVGCVLCSRFRCLGSRSRPSTPSCERLTSRSSRSSSRRC